MYLVTSKAPIETTQGSCFKENGCALLSSTSSRGVVGVCKILQVSSSFPLIAQAGDGVSPVSLCRDPQLTPATTRVAAASRPGEAVRVNLAVWHAARTVLPDSRTAEVSTSTSIAPEVASLIATVSKLVREGATIWLHLRSLLLRREALSVRRLRAATKRVWVHDILLRLWLLLPGKHSSWRARRRLVDDLVIFIVVRLLGRSCGRIVRTIFAHQSHTVPEVAILSIDGLAKLLQALRFDFEAFCKVHLALVVAQEDEGFQCGYRVNLLVDTPEDVVKQRLERCWHASAARRINLIALYVVRGVRRSILFDRARWWRGSAHAGALASEGRWRERACAIGGHGACGRLLWTIPETQLGNAICGRRRDIWLSGEILDSVLLGEKGARHYELLDLSPLLIRLVGAL